MSIPVPEELKTDRNDVVLAFIEPLSCHSDILGPLETSLSVFSDVKAFCPDSRSFRYFLFYVDNIVFAFAVGMQNVYLKLPEYSRESAIENGGAVFQEAGDNWYSFSWGMEEMSYWSKIAYENAKHPVC